MSDIAERLRVALQALNDWAVTYAADMCGEETVAQAKDRILEHGTLAYIANATDQLSGAIARIEQLERENAELRHIISNCAAALVTGAFVSPKASVEFMHNVPEEISLTVSGLRSQLASARSEARKTLQPFAQIADMEEQTGPSDSVMVNVARCRDARDLFRRLAEQEGTGKYIDGCAASDQGSPQDADDIPEAGK